MIKKIDIWLTDLIFGNQYLRDGQQNFRFLLYILIAIVLGFLLWHLTKYVLKSFIYKYAIKTEVLWDDELMKNKFFGWLSHIIPALMFYSLIPVVFQDFPNIKPLAFKIVNAFTAFVLMRTSIAFLSALTQILSRKESLKDKPIASYVQLIKIFVYIIGIVIIFSILFDKNPIFFFSAMGAMGAVLILIFKDTILGFVASIQISSYDMIRVGDWITFDKFGADGDVKEINLTTVKIQNFDKTITTVPTYSLISDSFKNWRGMKESDGRRIKRSVNIKVDSVKFCDDVLLEKLKSITLVKNYIEEKQAEIDKYNNTVKANKTELINGRNLTNIGIFRVYLAELLKSNDNINKEMSCMVRQLDPNETGIPMQIYAFISEKDWEVYEQITSDIFDHILAAVPFFDLEVFQNPTGADFRKL